MKYKIFVHMPVFFDCEIIIEAEDQEKAKDIALEKVRTGGLSWRQSADAEHAEVIDVETYDEEDAE